MIDVTKIPKQT